MPWTTRYVLTAFLICQSGVMGLRLGHILSLRTLLTLNDFKLHVVTLLQALIALGLDGAVVDEYIGPVVAADKTKALCIVEPFHFTFDSHFSCSTGRAHKAFAQPSFYRSLGFLPLL
jgi:hypothetical protein